MYVHVEKEAAKRGPVLSRTAAAWLVNTTAIDTIGPREWVAHADAIEAQLCQIENIQVWTEMGAKPGMLECSMIGRKPQLEAYQKALREYLNAVLNGERPSGNSSWKRAHKAPLPDLGSGEPLPRTRRAVHAAPTPTQIAAMNEVNHGYVRERIRDPSISPPLRSFTNEDRKCQYEYLLHKMSKIQRSKGRRERGVVLPWAKQYWVNRETDVQDYLEELEELGV